MAEIAGVAGPGVHHAPTKRANWVPYALLAPGLIWLFVFFVLPMITLGSQSLQEGSVEAGGSYGGQRRLLRRAHRFRSAWAMKTLPTLLPWIPAFAGMTELVVC